MSYMPQYPQDFFKYNLGESVSEKRINEWIQFALEQLKTGLLEDRISISSGGVIVDVIKIEDKYQIEVNKNTFEWKEF